MISVLLAARGSDIDSAKFIFFSFLLHCFLVGAFWFQDDVKPAEVATVMTISISDLSVEESVAPPQPKPQPIKKEKVMPIKKETFVPLKQEAPKPVGEPVQETVQSEPVPAQTKVDTKSNIDTPQEKQTPANFTANYLKNPTPAYPSVSRRLGETGTVMLKVQVLKDGTAGSVEVSKSSGYGRLDDCALEAVKKWRFVPAKKGDTPILSWVSVPVVFSLTK